jgi:hypothetical protein
MLAIDHNVGVGGAFPPRPQYWLGQASGRLVLKCEAFGVNILAAAHLALTRFQRDLLSEHDVADRQGADGYETEPRLWTTFFVDLTYVHRGACVNSITPSAIASNDLEVAFPD